MAAISIAIVSDTKGVVSDVKALSTEYSGLVEQLQKLGPEGAAAAEQLESQMKAAQLATQDAATASKELVDGINQAKLAAAAGGGGGSFASEMEDTAKSTDVASESVGRFGSKSEELKQGLSFNASFGLPMFAEQLAGGKNGVAGAADAAAQALGGMGMMMGPEVMIPATILGGAVAFLAGKLQEQADEAKAVTQMTTDLVSAWVKANPAATEFGKALQTWLQNSKDYGITLTALQKDTALLGMSLTDTATAMTSHNLPALEKMRDAMDQQTTSAERQIAIDRETRTSALQTTATGQDAAEKRVTASGAVRKALDEQIAALKESKAEEQLAADEMGLTDAAYKKHEKTLESWTQAAQDATTANDQMNSSLQSAIGSTGSSLDQILDRSKKDGESILKEQQKTIAANERFMKDFNAAVKAGLDKNGQEYVASNRAAFQEVVDTFGIHSPQARQFLSNANALGRQQSSDFEKNFATGAAQAMYRAEQIVRAQKLHPEFDFSGGYAQANALVNYINNQRPEVFVTVRGNGRLGSRIG